MAVLFTVLLTGCGLILGWLLYDFGQQNFIRETEAAIDSEITNTLSLMEALSKEEKTAFIAEKSAQQAHPLYLYQNTQEQKLAGNLPQTPKQVDRIAEGLISFQSENRQLAAKIHTFDDGTRLLVARNIDDIIASHQRLKWLSLLMFLFMLTVICVSFFISYFVVSRINRIGGIAGQIIETGDLSRRVQIDSNWDDLSNLGEALNLLLARIEELMQDVRDVADNIAHDLRTPLTRLRNQLESLQEESTTKKEQAVLLSEVDGLLSTFNALLRIANIEKGKRHQSFKVLDLGSLLQDVVELYEPLAEEKGISINAKILESSAFSGDRDLLFQFFANLLDNAIKFSPQNSEIQLELTQQGNGITIIISDHGIGIAQGEREKVFDRFYRSDLSRHEAGSGLGLSLVKAVLELHKGTISLGDNHPGLWVKIIF
ncbi:MAG: HAMP domain-containing sensor histidine kinase [Rickettsiales bacterium]|nr:HAMP domain-containing sensor histidine kinase [Rickettsiales bacterium]